MHPCVRSKIPVHLLEGWWFRCIHAWGVGYWCIYLRSDDLRCIHVRRARFRCIYSRDDDFGAFMCEGYDISVSTWGVTSSVGRISVHLPEEWRFSVNSCVRGQISVHSLEGWWFRCIHVWGVGYRCIYLRSDNFGAFMCDGQDFGAFTRGRMICGAFICEGYDISVSTWRVTISVHCVRVVMSLHLPEKWRFRSIHVWGVRFRCIHLRDDDVGAFMFKG